VILVDAPLDPDGFELLASQAEVRAVDALVIAGSAAPSGPEPTAIPGLPGRLLMELAGARAALLIRERAGGIAGKAVVLCGPGNNGGDGWVVARHLANQGFVVRCVALAAPLAGTDAHANFALWQALSADSGETRWAERGATARMRNWLNHANVIVDALFGTGLGRPLEGAAAELVEVANAAEHGLKVALDLPSGLDTDRGDVLGVAFEADLTVTFGIAKRGLYLGSGPAHAGEIVVVDIGWPRQVMDRIGPSARLARPQAMARLVPARPSDGHKGSFGHVAVVGGFTGKEGAALLACRAVLRSGAGLVSWVGEAGHNGQDPVTRPPEVMSETLGEPLAPRANALVIGPGLGTSDAAKDALRLAERDPRPAVWDADALNLIAASPEGLEGLAAQSGAAPRVLTPHPLEAARLLGMDRDAVEADRFAAAETLAARAKAVVILKGGHTLVAAPGHPTVLFDRAEPTLAVGGSGDVLGGLVAGLMAQGVPPRDAALLGVWVHAEAGLLAGLGQAQRGALASEIADAIASAWGRL
jgi:NAD(P)H-hydrate epimerase